ncbi:MAG: hypothetical protein AB1486_07315 [Planctomycetota bacterium]
MAKCGILYIVTGQPTLLAEAEASAESVRQWMPGFSIAIVTDLAPRPELFDIILRADGATRSFFDKPAFMSCTPFEKTLFLDSDTFVCTNVADIFAMLDRFDLAACHAPARYDATGPAIEDPGLARLCGQDIPECFPTLNTGVIVYRKTPSVVRMLNCWRDTYREQIRQGFVNCGGWDQGGFRVAVYRTDVQFYVLPPEYNVRLGHPYSLSGKARVLHAHRSKADFIRIRDILNSSRTPRLVVRDAEVVYGTKAVPRGAEDGRQTIVTPNRMSGGE